MPQNPAKLVVVGHGAAGLAAALSAAEQARSRGLPIDITVLEKSREDEAGGNTRWSPSNMRLDAPDRIDPGFADDMLQDVRRTRRRQLFSRAGGQRDRDRSDGCRRHGVEFVTPVYYLSAGPARIQPVGGGGVIVAKLLAAAKRAGVKVRYDAEASRLVMAAGHRVGGIEVQHRRRCHDNARRRCRHSRQRRIPGQPRDDARAFRAGRRDHQADLAGNALRYRRRHPHGDRAGRAAFPATGTACTSSRSIRAARIPRRSCWSILTASWSISTATASSTKAVA